MVRASSRPRIPPCRRHLRRWELLRRRGGHGAVLTLARSLPRGRPLPRCAGSLSPDQAGAEEEPMVIDDVCLKVQVDIATLDRIARDDRARREFLWLRAHEKED